jgi:hypothetical protein
VPMWPADPVAGCHTPDVSGPKQAFLPCPHGLSGGRISGAEGGGGVVEENWTLNRKRDGVQVLTFLVAHGRKGRRFVKPFL